MDWNTISALLNIILTLLLLFQWFWDRSRERAVRNGLFAARRVASRVIDPNAESVIDILDSALATTGARRPFTEWAKNVTAYIWIRADREEKVPVTQGTTAAARS